MVLNKTQSYKLGAGDFSGPQKLQYDTSSLYACQFPLSHLPHVVYIYIF